MPRFAALDTRFLLALAAGESDAEDTIDYLGKNGFFPLITQSVVEQLGELHDNPNSPEYPFAVLASKNYPSWGIIDPPNLYVDNGTSDVHAEKLISQGLLPDATVIEAEMLIEASCHKCELLITFSSALLGADSLQLNLSLIENDLETVTIAIASPAVIAARLKSPKSA